MGYMGFGMRKEVYTRKPKEAFKKLKQHHGETPKKGTGLNDSEYLELKQHRKSAFRHFYQSRVFLFFSCALIVVSLFGLLWFFVLSDYYIAYQQSQYDQTGITDYYESNKNELAIVHLFFNNRRDKIESVFEGFLGHQTLKIKSADLLFSYNIDSINRVNFHTDWTDKKCTIDTNSLTVSGKGFIPKTYSEKWLLDIAFSNSKPVNSSILKYLKTDWNELNGILQTLKKNNWTVSCYENYISIHYKHPLFDNYNLIFTDSSPNELHDWWEIDSSKVSSGTISKGKVYWSRLKN